MASNNVGGSGGGSSSMRYKMMMLDRTVDQLMEDQNEEDELSMPVVTSDVLQPQLKRARTKKTMSSLLGSQPQSPSHANLSEQGNGPLQQPPSQTRLAVHIRSSPIKAFTPINMSATREPSTLSLGRSRGRPPGSCISRPPTPDAFSSLHTSTPNSETKKRGRPKGWKPGMRYSTDPNSKYRKREAKRLAEAEGQNQVQGRGQEPKKQGQSQEPKKRGRPRLASPPPEPSLRERYLQSKPDYIPYKCEWDLSENPQQEKPSICPAELHNMDTLRRHVLFIHGDADPLICQFARCRDRNPPLRFETDEEFEKHMEKKHFASYLWHLGEGYQNNGIWTVKEKSDQLPAYLFDKNGKQVTPSIADQQFENDIQRKERKRKLRRLLYQQNENAPSEEEWKNQMLGIA